MARLFCYLKIEKKKEIRTMYGSLSKYRNDYRYFCMPSVASEGSPLMETVNFTPFFSPN